jgi:hypothetical protein
MSNGNYLMSIEYMKALEFENKLDEFTESLSLTDLTTNAEYLSLGCHVTSPEEHNTDNTIRVRQRAS